MNQDPALTPARVDALNAVDLRLFGVTHGTAEYVDGIPHVRGGEDSDFDGLLAATNDLIPERGDVLAVEPTGFSRAWVEDLTLASVLPVTVPDIPLADMSREHQADIAAFLEIGRRELYINNLVYAAAHALLRGVPVHRAEVSRQDWDNLTSELSELDLSADIRTDIEIFYRSTKMLARLGDIAIAMIARTSHQATSTADDTKPILLSATGSPHPPRLGRRLSTSGVSFTSNA